MKKILCFLLCVMLLIPSAVSLADGNLPISSITVNLTAPTAGQTVRDKKNPTEPSGAPYFVADCYWMKKNGNSFMDMDPDEIFAEGQVYLFDVHVIADSGYEFDPNVVVNSNAVVKQARGNGSDYFISLQTTAQKKAPTEKVTLSKLKSVKLTALSAKKLKVTWKKLSSKDQKKIQKIEVQYSTDKTFKTGVKIKWAKKTKSSYTISGLKKNTKYYVRIRAYKKSGDVIYVSKWVTKNKKTKK